ncbi:MAG: hypothetical protein OH354_04930 [Candidatus Parvarchaeota archaeon]|nr:hypothetical protein [Candidatus Jingweiarchaeum tengchongense]
MNNEIDGEEKLEEGKKEEVEKKEIGESKKESDEEGKKEEIGEKKKESDVIEIDLGNIFGFFKNFGKKKEKLEGDKEKEVEEVKQEVKEEKKEIEVKEEEKGEEKKLKEEELELNLDSLINLFKKHNKILVYLVLFLFIILTIYSRTRNIPNLEGKYLISPDDPYIFYRYTKMIVENGSLPENDTMRYYPHGFETSRELLVPAYLTAYSYLAAKAILPNINFMDVVYYYAPICFALSLIGFFFLAKEILKDDLFSLITVGLIAFSYPVIFRTTSGFIEKEPIFTLAFSFAMLFYVKSMSDDKRKVIFFSLLSGIFSSLAALSSGLTFYIIAIISLYCLAKILFENFSDNDFLGFIIWFFILMFTLGVVTTRYGGITGLIKIYQFQIPALVILFYFSGLIVKWIRNKLKIEIRKIPLSFIQIFVGVLITIVVASIVFGIDFVPKTFIDFVNKLSAPMGRELFTLSVSENQPPVFFDPYRGSDWWHNFNIFIPFFFIGPIFLILKIFKEVKLKYFLAMGLVLVLFQILFENPSPDPRFSGIHAVFQFDYVYYFIFLISLLYLLFYEWKKGRFEVIKGIESRHIFFFCWFLFSMIASNGAIRLFFMVAFPAMLMTSYSLKEISIYLEKFFKREELFRYVIFILLFIYIIFFSFTKVSATIGNMSPGLEDWYKAMYWIRDNTPKNAVFTHWWDYGYLVQAIGERTTTLDPGNYIYPGPMGGHVFGGENASEVLAQLEIYGRPDYWLICSEDVLKFFQISRLGFKETYFSPFICTESAPNTITKDYPNIYICKSISGGAGIDKDFVINNQIFSRNDTFIIAYYIPFSENETGLPLAYTYNRIYGMNTLPVNCMCTHELGCVEIRNDSVPTCIMIMPGGILNIPYKARNMLFTHLYLLNQTIPGFKLAYETPTPLSMASIIGRGTNVRIYEINYTELEEAANQNLTW